MFSRVLVHFTVSSGDNAPNRHTTDAALLRGPLVLLCLVAAVAMAGCKKQEVRVPVVSVKGKVAAFRGEVPVGAFVTLRRTDAEGPLDVSPSATVESDGSFVIGSYGKGDGAPPGEYAVTVTWFKVVGAESGPNVLPAKFASAGSTPVKVSVTGPTEIPTIEFSN